MKKVVLFFALAVGLLASASTAMAQVNMSRYITLTVKSGKKIKLNFTAAASGTPVSIVSGSNTQNITVGIDWKGFANYTAGSTTMTVYGDLIGFNCGRNYGDLTAIDVSHNTQLTELSCPYNQLTSLDVSNNTQLTELYCYNNKLTTLDVSKNTQLNILNCSSNTLRSLDVSQNTQLTYLDCSDNKLSSLDVSQNTQLMGLHCSYDSLTTLNVSQNTQLTYLNCSFNQLTTLDISRNTKLTVLCCHGNDLSTQTLDDIYCALPDRTGKANGKIQPIRNSSSPDLATVLATNKQNAIAKNWKVQYYYPDSADIPATTGTYVCGTPHPVDTSRYITLTVSNGEVIKLDFKAAAANTSVRIKSGITDTTITVGTSWKGITSYTAADSVMTVYGDIIVFYCSNNRAKLTAIDLSHHTQLTELYCTNNKITSLDVSNNTQLTGLYCTSNQLSSLNISGCTQLKELYCYNNILTALDVSGCTQLTKVYCHDNKLSTDALDDIYCALPDRKDSINGVIQPVDNSSSTYNDTVIASNAANATAKNWKVQYYSNDADIPATTGKHKCSATDIAEAAAEPALTLYPNPVADVLYLSATARTIRVYNIYGTEVAHATDTDRIDVAHLPAGVYTVRADGTVAKMVKR